MNIGRLGGKAFAVSMLASFVIILLLALLNVPIEMVMTFAFVNCAWMILIYIGRLHDTGYSGWWSLLVMFTSLLGIIVLAAYPGTKGPNKYGDVPPSNVSHLLHFWRTQKTS